MKLLSLLVLSFGFCCSSFAASLVERCEADILSGYINNGVVISADDFRKRIDIIDGTADIPPSVAFFPILDSYEEMSRRLVDIDGLPQAQTARNILDVYEKATEERKRYFIGALVSMLYDRMK
jgi:hypothetical protein